MKRLHLKLLIFVFLSAHFVSFANPTVPAKSSSDHLLQNWTKLRSDKDQLTLSLKSNSAVYISITKSKGLNSKAFREPSFSLKTLNKYKQTILSVISIQDWRLSSSHWQKLKNNREELNLRGSYTNHEKQKQYFQELHIYSPLYVLQVLVSAPSLKELKSAKPEEFFKIVRTEGLKILE